MTDKNKEREAFETWLATSAQDIAGDDWSTQNIWLGGYRAALAPALRERDLAALMHPAVAGMSPAGAIGWLAIELDAVQSGGEPVGEVVHEKWTMRDGSENRGGRLKLYKNLLDVPDGAKLYAAPAPVGEPARADRQEWMGPVVIDRTHPNQAYVTFGFSDEAECTQFIKATRYGSPVDRQGVALSEREAFEAWIEAVPVSMWSAWGRREAAHAAWIFVSSRASSSRAEVENAAARDVLAERRRQVEVEGWTPEHDDAHEVGDMALAAACYAAGGMIRVSLDDKGAGLWPWAEHWFKPTSTRRNLVKAGALILAEIERIDRLAAAEAPKEGS